MAVISSSSFWETIEREPSVLDEIRNTLPLNTDTQFAYARSYCIFIKKNDKTRPHIIETEEFREYVFWVANTKKIIVGEKWLSDEQWSKLVIMRLNGDISFQEKDDTIEIVEKPENSWIPYSSVYRSQKPNFNGGAFIPEFRVHSFSGSSVTYNNEYLTAWSGVLTNYA